MDRPLSDFDVLSFDCYGTLIDWEAGIRTSLEPLLVANPGVELPPGTLLETYAALEPVVEREEPERAYEEILTRVHGALAKRLGLTTTPELDAAFGQSIPHWLPFPDSGPALERLGQRFKLVILSNVSRAGIAASIRHLGVSFDAVYTAEDIGSYKPDLRNFHHLIEGVEDAFGIVPDRILHVAQSVFHDHVPARQLGLANAWIDRQRLCESGLWGATARVDALPDFAFHVHSLAELADAAVG